MGEPRSITRALDAASHSSPTYRGTEDGIEGYTVADYRTTVGYGIVAFHTAREGLRTWQAHQVPGLRVFPIRESVQQGATYLLTFGTSLLSIAAPCRVTSVIDEPWHYAFTYATLPGHPEVGEETFELRLDLDDVVFAISSTSKPNSRLAGSPPGRRVQRSTSRRYLRALARYVQRHSPLPLAT
jgi:uncharacterized protein (UPF0548 family)